MPDKRKSPKKVKKPRRPKSAMNVLENFENYEIIPDFEALWNKNKLYQSFTYVGHVGQTIIMQCITLLPLPDDEFHICGQRFRIKQGNYGNLARHKETVHRNFVNPSCGNDLFMKNEFENDQHQEFDNDQPQEFEMSLDPNMVINSQEQTDISNQNEEVSFEEPVNTSADNNNIVHKRPVKLRNLIQKRFNENIVALCADGFPIEYIHRQSFRNFVSSLNPHIRLKSKDYYVKMLNNVIQSQVKPNLQNILDNTNDGCCHFALDVWWLKPNHTVLGINIYCITKDWNYVERTLFITCLTTLTIEDEFKKCLRTFNVPIEKVGMVVIDDAVKMLKTFNLCHILRPSHEISISTLNEDNNLEDECNDFFDDLFKLEEMGIEGNSSLLNWFVPCNVRSCAHLLQNVLKEAILSDTMAVHELIKVHKTLNFFRRCHKWSTALKTKMKLIPNLQGKSFNIGHSGKTRWNLILDALQLLSDESTYDLVNTTIMEAMTSIGDASANASSNEVALGSTAKILELSFLLNSFGTALECLLSNSNTSHKLLLAIIKVFKDVKETDVWYFHDLKKGLLNGLIKNFEPSFHSEDFALATICDPRQKLRLFEGVNFGCGLELRILSKTAAVAILKSHYSSLRGKNPRSKHHSSNENGVKVEINEEASLDPKSKKLKRDIIDDIDVVAPLENLKTHSHKSEIDVYLSEPYCPNDLDVIQYWKQSSFRFPILSKIAMKYLGIGTSSACIQRNFIQTFKSDYSKINKSTIHMLENQILYREFKTYD